MQLGVEPGEAIRSSPADTQLATRALLERRPRIARSCSSLDDLHWAEPPLFDLVEHVCDWSRGAPIFLLCIARPELLDVRPGWAGGKLNATSFLLEPLDDLATAELVDGCSTASSSTRDAGAHPGDRGGEPALPRGDGRARPGGGRRRRGAADDPCAPPGTARHARRRGADGDRARRGRGEGLPPRRRHRARAGPKRDDVPGRLLSLVRKELVRPDRTQIPGDDAFRFRHLLIRDTAYESLPKAVRADLHERFADWLDAHAALYEQDELLGYHLEQAARYRAELDADDPARPRSPSGRRPPRCRRSGGVRPGGLPRDPRVARARRLAPPRRAGAAAALPYRLHALIESGDPTLRADARELAEGDAVDRAVAFAFRLLSSPDMSDVAGELAQARPGRAHARAGRRRHRAGVLRGRTRVPLLGHLPGRADVRALSGARTSDRCARTASGSGTGSSGS